jgi:hypothetical protein
MDKQAFSCLQGVTVALILYKRQYGMLLKGKSIGAG